MQPDFVCMEDVELDLLGQIGIKGKAVAHLCCNNGIELLSLKNLGANECIGFDISDLAIQEAQERAERCQIDCQYVRSDVYEIGPEYEDRFDVVYISSGGLGWLPDLTLFFARAAAMLGENGQVFIHEIHPFSEMLPFDDTEDVDILRIVEPYFKTEPYIDYGGLDYVGGTEYTSTKPQYWFVHKLSDILMALIENQISQFRKSHPVTQEASHTQSGWGKVVPEKFPLAFQWERSCNLLSIRQYEWGIVGLIQTMLWFSISTGLVLRYCQISIEHFSEYETDISAGRKRIEQAQAGIPLSYILIARKQSAS